MRKPTGRMVVILATVLALSAFGSVVLVRQSGQQQQQQQTTVDSLRAMSEAAAAAAAAEAAAAAAKAGAAAAAAGTPQQAPPRQQQQKEKAQEEEEPPAPADKSKTVPLSLKAGMGSSGMGPLNIKYIALIGERHSGSTWMTNILQEYFRGKGITVTPILCTFKHWFQDRIRQDIIDGKRVCRDMQPCPACADVNHTLVVTIWRNPYDWISGMHKIPWHAQAHAGVEDVSEFMTMPWIMGPELEQQARQEAEVKAKDNSPCLDSFVPGEVLPCREGHRGSIYELNPQGEAYGNIYELRKAKIQDFNQVKTWAPYYEKILYEDLLVGNGLRDWLKSLDTLYGLSGNYESVPDPATRKKMETSAKNMLYLNSKNCVPHCKMGGLPGRKAAETVNRLWDTELEEEIGYRKLQHPLSLR